MTTTRIPARVCTCGHDPHNPRCPSWHRPHCPICARLARRKKATT